MSIQQLPLLNVVKTLRDLVDLWDRGDLASKPSSTEAARELFARARSLLAEIERNSAAPESPDRTP
jgi:hypothetical protein